MYIISFKMSQIILQRKIMYYIDKGMILNWTYICGILDTVREMSSLVLSIITANKSKREFLPFKNENVTILNMLWNVHR